MTDNDRQRGIIVYPLHEEIYKENPGFDRYVLGINPHTEETYLIHDSEGVGYPVSHQKPWRFNDFSLLSKWYTVAEVRSWANLAEPLDLADVVRTFGARLESNFYGMALRLTTETPMQDDYQPEVAKVFRKEREETAETRAAKLAEVHKFN